MVRALAPLLCAAALLGCAASGDASSSGPDGGEDSGLPSPCGTDEAPEDGGCEPVGVPASMCAPGELPLEGGGCQPAGVPPEHCAQGFTPEGDGCAAILPSMPCEPGTMAVPGDAACRDVAPCAPGDWGDIPVDATTQYVNAAFAGSASDGSAAQPWKTIQEGIDAAAPGALVAVAAGTYTETPVLGGKSVRLWGRCPSLVAIVGNDDGLIIGAGADDSEVHDLSVTAPGWAAISVSGVKGVVIERVWLHDGTTVRGFDLTDGGDGTEVTIRGSLLENMSVIAIMVWGATATIEASEVRDTHALRSGYGLMVAYSDTHKRAKATVRGSVLAHNERVGAYVWASDATIDATVVKDTQPDPDGFDGFGIRAQMDPDTKQRANLTLRRSIVAGNSFVGIEVIGADATIEDTVVQDTQPAGEGTAGFGVAAADDTDTMEVAHVTVRSSLIERAHAVGIAASGSSLSIEGTIVRDTLPQPSDQGGGHGLEIFAGVDTGQRASAEVRGSVFENNLNIGVLAQGSDLVLEDTAVRDTAPLAGIGRGIDIQEDIATNQPSTATIARCLVEKSYEVGVFAAGATVSLEATTIRDTRPHAGSGALGYGVSIQPGPATGPSHASITTSRIERSESVGLLVYDADVTVDATVVADTAAQASDGSFGDGILVQARTYDASAQITRSVVERSARVGVSSFGGHVSLGSSVLECNPIHLDSEHLGKKNASFEDLGANACGCDGTLVACQIMSASLSPPDPAPESSSQ